MSLHPSLVHHGYDELGDTCHATLGSNLAMQILPEPGAVMYLGKFVSHEYHTGTVGGQANNA